MLLNIKRGKKRNKHWENDSWYSLLFLRWYPSVPSFQCHKWSAPWRLRGLQLLTELRDSSSYGILSGEHRRNMSSLQSGVNTKNGSLERNWLYSPPPPSHNFDFDNQITVLRPAGKYRYQQCQLVIEPSQNHYYGELWKPTCSFKTYFNQMLNVWITFGLFQ